MKSARKSIESKELVENGYGAIRFAKTSHRQKAYHPKRLTHNTIKKSENKAADTTYKYYSTRGISAYQTWFGTDAEHDLLEFIKKKTQTCKLQFLDCGAGQGRAIGDLLKEKLPGVVADKCTGISLHYFENIQKLLNEHKSHLDWYCDKAQNVLPNLKGESYDVITDLFGAYFYTSDRLLFLNEYHRLLKPGGRAYILTPKSGTNNEQTEDKEHLAQNRIQFSKQNSMQLEEYLVEHYPETFSWGNKIKTFLIMNKVTQRAPALNFKVAEVKERVLSDYTPTKAQLKEFKKTQQGFFPHKMTLKPTPPSYSLRSLPYKKPGQTS